MNGLIAATTEAGLEGVLLCLVYGLLAGVVAGVVAYGIALAAHEPPRKWATVAACVIGGLVALFCIL